MPQRQRPNRRAATPALIAKRDPVAYKPVFDLLSEASAIAVRWWACDDSASPDEALRLAVNAIRLERALGGLDPDAEPAEHERPPGDATEDEVIAWAMQLVRIQRFHAQKLASEFGYGHPPAAPSAPTGRRRPRPLGKKERLDLLATLQGHVVEQARENVNAAVEYALTDDDTGDYVCQSPAQIEWHRLCEAHDRLVLFSSIGSGKSTQISVFRSAWLLGRNHDLRIVVLSNASSQSSKLVVQAAKLIESNERFKEIFPTLKPSLPWNNSEIAVQRTTGAKDPSIRGVGVAGALTSARVDVLILDDLLDPESTVTEALRTATFEWVRTVALSRLQPGARVCAVGTPYHATDAMARLSAMEGWTSARFPIVNDDGSLAWPEKWPDERVEKARIDLGALEFSRQLRVQSRDDSSARFKKEHLDRAQEKGSTTGLVDDLVDIFPDGQLPAGFTTWTGVDLGFGKNKSSKASAKSDDCALVTFLQNPKGSRRILSIKVGKFDGPQMVKLIRREHEKFDSKIAVENNAGQQLILDFMPGARDYLFSHTTTGQKNDPILGVEGLAIELEQGTWVFPGRSREMDRLVTACLNFSPAKHLDDVAAALYFARSLAKRLLGTTRVPEVRCTFIGTPGERERERRAAAREEPSAAEVAYRKSLFGEGEPVAAPEPEPEEERGTVEKPIEIVPERGFFERLFTPPSRPANDMSERDAREARRDGGRSSTDRSVRRSVDRLLDGDASAPEGVHEVGSWQRGGWRKGGVL